MSIGRGIFLVNVTNVTVSRCDAGHSVTKVTWWVGVTMVTPPWLSDARHRGGG